MKISRWLQNKTKAILRCARRRPQAAILGLISLTMRKRRWPLKRNFICGLWIVGVDWPSQSTGRSEPGGDPQERWDGPLWVVSPSRGGFCSDSVKRLIFRVRPPQLWRRCCEKTLQSVRRRRSRWWLEWRRSWRERWRRGGEHPVEEERHSVEDIGEEEMKKCHKLIWAFDIWAQNRKQVASFIWRIKFSIALLT